MPSMNLRNRFLDVLEQLEHIKEYTERIKDNDTLPTPPISTDVNSNRVKIELNYGTFSREYWDGISNPWIVHILLRSRGNSNKEVVLSQHTLEEIIDCLYVASLFIDCLKVARTVDLDNIKNRLSRPHY